MSQIPSSSNSTPNLYVDLAVAAPQASKPSTPNAGASKTPKPANVFSNDGSFLERFQQSKQVQPEKKGNDESASKKREFADRFKNRGKRSLPEEETKGEEANSPKKRKSDKELREHAGQYEQEVKHYKGRSLKDDGTGVRPLVK